MTENKEKHHHKPTEKSVKIQKSIVVRLNRVEGQIRGIKNMIEKETYCDEIINQIEASRSALSAIGLILLEGHFKNCIVERIENGHHEAVDEILKTMKKLIK